MENREQMTDGRQSGRRALIITILLAMLAGFWWGWEFTQQRQVLAQAVENGYQRAFYDYLEQVEQLELLCGKLQACEDLQAVLLLTDLAAAAQTAANAAAALPLPQQDLALQCGWLHGVSSLAQQKTEQLLRGGALVDADREQLNAVYEEAQLLYAELLSLENSLADGLSLRNYIQPQQPLGAAQPVLAEAETDAITASMLRLRGLLEAEAAEVVEARGLAGMKVLSLDAAAEAAQRYLQQLGYTEAVLEEACAVEAAIPAYLFRYGAGEELLYLTLSQAGGQLLALYGGQAPQQLLPQLSLDEAAAQAQDYAAVLGYGDMHLSELRQIEENLLVELAAVDKGVICYPDALQLLISLHDGTLLAFDAGEYWLNHTAREYAPALSAGESAAYLPDGVGSSAVQAAVIADGRGGEVLCYEHICCIGEEEYWAYLHGDVGSEEQVLRCSRSDNGEFYCR